MFAFCDNTGEFLAAVLRPGNAGSNTAADHITVLDQALAQIPDEHRHGHLILVRADGAGCTKAFLAHIRSQRDTGVSCEFSVGWAIGEREHAAIALLPATDWTAAVDTDGEPARSTRRRSRRSPACSPRLSSRPTRPEPGCWYAGNARIPAPNWT
jgi:hypothetical protein